MPEKNNSAVWQKLSLRSQLLSNFLDRLHAEGIEYVVMNNYEDLPWDIPSDVDFTIPHGLFTRLDRFILEFAREWGAVVVQKFWHGNMKCAYVLATGAKDAFEFIQLDFFVDFSTKGCPALISHKEMVAGRRQLRNFQVPRPEVEILFIIMRRLFKDDWSERHCARLAELNSHISYGNWLYERYGWLKATLEAATRGNLCTVRASCAGDWTMLRQVSKENLSLSHRLANAAIQMLRIGIRLRDETGHLAVVTGPSEFVDDSAMESLELVFHRRLYIDETNLAARTSIDRLTLPAILALLKRRKGLVFLLVGPDQPLAQQMARKLDNLRLVDQMLQIGSMPSLLGLRAPTIRVETKAEVIESIVTRQASKTTRSITRGGTQTSG